MVYIVCLGIGGIALALLLRQSNRWAALSIARKVKSCHPDDFDIEALAAEGGDILARDENGWMAIHWVAATVESGSDRKAALLLKHGAPVNARSAKGCGASSGPYGPVVFDPGGSTPAHIAVRAGNGPLLSLLLSMSADLTVSDHEGVSVAMLYLRRRGSGHFDPWGISDVKILDRYVEQGGDLQARDNLGQTLLHVAPTADVVSYLCREGIDVNSRSKRGDTPLCHACTSDVARALIGCGADVNPSGVTCPPLCWAVVSGNIDLFEYLLRHGADASIKSGFGESVFELVDERSERRYAELLKPYRPSH